MYETFIFRGRARCGAAFLCGGLGPAGSAAPGRQSLLKLETLDFSAAAFLGEPSAVDSALARALRAWADPALLAVGVSLRLPGLAWRSGGVIGSPFAPARSAAGLLEGIGPDLWLHASPGGPGLVCVGEEAAIADLFAELDNDLALAASSESGLAGLRALYERLCRQGPAAFLGLSDGSGPDARGAVFAKAGEQSFFEVL